MRLISGNEACSGGAENFNRWCVDRSARSDETADTNQCNATGKPGRLAFQALLGSPFTDLLVDASRLSTIVGCAQAQPPTMAGNEL